MIFQLLEEVDNGITGNAVSFCNKELGIQISTTDGLKQVLNRPIRVCGMVENKGEPGGGPFWVKNKKGETTLQIVEKAQIDLSNETQKEILNGSTHFNPVDLACWITDWRGEKFDLLKYRDDDTGFYYRKIV